VAARGAPAGRGGGRLCRQAAYKRAALITANKWPARPLLSDKPAGRQQPEPAARRAGAPARRLPSPLCIWPRGV